MTDKKGKPVFGLATSDTGIIFEAPGSTIRGAKGNGLKMPSSLDVKMNIESFPRRFRLTIFENQCNLLWERGSFVVSIAQLVERRTVDPGVAGSTPVTHPTLSRP